MSKSTCKNLILIISIVLIVTFSTACSKTIDDVTYEGINVVWVPVIQMWKWLWNSFTPNFWDELLEIWDILPASISWLPGIISFVVGTVVYVIIAGIVLIIDVILTIIITIIWVICWIFVTIFNSVF